jgi:hypothetical protein
VSYRTNNQKLQGDPGIFGFVGKALGTITGIASKVLPGPLGTAAGLVSGVLSPQAPPPQVSPRVLPSGTPPFVRPGQGFVQQGPSPRTPTSAVGFGPVGARQRKRRRMDPLNPKALRRATRRLAAFNREKAKVEKELRKIAPRPRTRTRRDLPPGHTHTR